MPKKKTHKGILKRVKVTATGKIKIHQPGKSHLMASKSGKRRRQLRKAVIVSGKLAKRLRP